MAISDNLIMQVDVNTRSQSATVPYDHVNSTAGVNGGSPTTVGSGDNTSMSYDGTDGMYSDINLPGDSWTNGAFTIAVRADLTNSANTTHPFGVYSNSSFTQVIYLNLSGTTAQWTIGNSSGGTIVLSMGTKISGEAVYTLTRNGTSWEAFVNGTSVATTTGTWTHAQTMDEIGWGANLRSTTHVAESDVDIQWSALWDAEKSLADIQSLDDVENPFLSTPIVLTAGDGTLEIGESGLPTPVAAGSEVFTADPDFSGAVSSGTLDGVSITSKLSSASVDGATLGSLDVTDFRVGGSLNAVRWGQALDVEMSDGTDTGTGSVTLAAPVPTRFGTITSLGSNAPAAAQVGDERYGLWTTGEGIFIPETGAALPIIYEVGEAVLVEMVYDLSAGAWIEGSPVTFLEPVDGANLNPLTKDIQININFNIQGNPNG